MSQIIHLAQARPDEMLQRLKRLTGLDFQQVPESLLDAGPVTGASLPLHDPSPCNGQKKAGPEGRRQAHGQQDRPVPERCRV